MKNMKKKSWVALSVLLPACIVGWLIFSNFEELCGVIRTVRWQYLLLSMSASAASYVFIGLSLWEVLRLIGHRLPFLEVTGIALVSTTANYFVSSVGISGFALRAHLLHKRRVPYGASVTASVVITVLLYMILALIIVQGCIFQFLRPHTSSMQLLQGAAGVFVLLGLAFVIGALFFHHEIRAKWSRTLFRKINHVIYFFSSREIPQETFEQFEHQLENGIHVIHRQKRELTRAISCICADWVSTLLILYFAFRAIGVTLDAGQLIVGFSLGMVATLIPILPGGLGAMEVTMTAAYSQMGIPWGTALMASLIYRFCYYLIPSVFSIFIYWGLKMSEPPDFPVKLEKRWETHNGPSRSPKLEARADVL